MEDNEEYLLRALRRTSSGLTDSLIPAHGAKLTKLLAKFESVNSVTKEIQTLLNVQGFGKCALAMEWLLERTKGSSDYVAPEQFESDVLLLNEKLFEAFLNQPFDMPDFSHTFQAPTRPIQQNIQVTDDEFLGTSFPVQESTSEINYQASIEPESIPESIAGPNWDTSSSIASIESVQPSGYNDGSQSDKSPSLADAMSAELYESTERISQIAVEFSNKQPAERPLAIAVLRITVRTSLDISKSTGNVIAQDYFESFLKLIAYADEHGKIRNEIFSDIIRDTGDRLSFALKQSNGGIALLKDSTKYINNPKELFSKT